MIFILFQVCFAVEFYLKEVYARLESMGPGQEYNAADCQSNGLSDTDKNCLVTCAELEASFPDLSLWKDLAYEEFEEGSDDRYDSEPILAGEEKEYENGQRK